MKLAVFCLKELTRIGNI